MTSATVGAPARRSSPATSLRRRSLRLRLAVVAGCAGLGMVGLLASAPTSAQAAASGQVYLVQGLPGSIVDLVIDGNTVAAASPATSVVGPLSLASGSHTLSVRSGGKSLLDRTFAVAASTSADIVVHRPASPVGAPVITTFANDLSAIPADKALVVVAHTAAVPPADIRVNGKVLFANVANGESLSLVVPPATYKVDIVPTGATSPLILGPLDLTVKAGALNRVFAIGEPTSQTMNAVVQVLQLPASGTASPTRVNTGTGGVAAAMGLTGLTWRP
ncbi:MAG: DUF4397 domain-containing protein [Lapillicoccus sp.]